MAPLKILVLCRIKQAAGVATIAQNFIRGFDRLGSEVSFLKLDSDLEFLGNARDVAQIIGLQQVLTKRMTFDVAFCITDEFVWYSLFLQRFLGRPKIFATVIHPRHYCYKLEDNSHPAEVSLVRAKLLGSKSGFIFMNGQCKRSHEAFYEQDISGAVLPLPVVRGWPTAARQSQRGKIVSVGRLVNFKNHHISLIRELLPHVDRGAKLEYWIYGDGPDKAALEDFIESAGASSFCRVEGRFPYSRFQEILHEAWAFVGMGTSAIEAASLGVPTIIPVESRADAVSYGLFGVDYQSLEVGEAIPGMPEEKISEIILRLQHTSRDAYEAISVQTASTSQDFEVETVCQQYIETFSRSRGISEHLSLTEFMRYLNSRRERRLRSHPDSMHM